MHRWIKHSPKPQAVSGLMVKLKRRNLHWWLLIWMLFLPSFTFFEKLSYSKGHFTLTVNTKTETKIQRTLQPNWEVGSHSYSTVFSLLKPKQEKRQKQLETEGAGLFEEL